MFNISNAFKLLCLIIIIINHAEIDAVNLGQGTEVIYLTVDAINQI